MSTKVIIIGGGVAGLSAAHEFAIRRAYHTDLEVYIYDANEELFGGKARSIPIKNSGIGNRRDLSGEHGFRFIPGFYKHLPDTLKKIPFSTDKSVYDNLVETTQLLIGRFDTPPFIAPSKLPKTPAEFATTLEANFLFERTGLTKGDAKFFASKLWQIATTCKERAFADFEKIVWWDFIEADTRSKAYQKFLGNGLSRSLTANDPHKASTLTLGRVYLQLFMGIITPGIASDLVFNAPTNEAWINPWLDFLKEKGINYQLGAHVRKIECHEGKITSITIDNKNKQPETISGDYFIFAVPVEAMAALLETDMLENGNVLKADPSLKSILTLQKHVSWMNGLQLYLNERVDIVHGHQLYVDSPWAITAISQIQFWENSGYSIEQYGNGRVKGIISVDISNWDNMGILYNKPAKDCTAEEIKDEIWAQLKKSLNSEKEILNDRVLETWFLDPDIEDIKSSIDTGCIHINTEPLLVNRVNSWILRPESYTRISNMFLASDYVRTYCDLACMEAANEAARRAVNGVLNHMKSEASLCELWDVLEPEFFRELRDNDRVRFQKGLPWEGKLF
jgi:uncharacterized protein with NAD-binding domain and iron-sulfur cluster